MKQKTDWEIARKLADYVLTFGEHKHDCYNKYGEATGFQAVDSVISLYNDGRYVSVECIKDNVKFVCHDHSCPLPEISKDCPNLSDIDFDIRKIDKIVRKRLRPLVKRRDEIKNTAKEKEIQSLRDRLMKLEG